MSFWHWAIVLIVLLLIYGFTRLPLWLMRSWTTGGVLRLFVAHLMCFLLVGVVAGIVGHAPVEQVLAIYGVILGVIFVVDVVRYRRRSPAVTAVQRPPVARDMNRQRRRA